MDLDPSLATVVKTIMRGDARGARHHHFFYTQPILRVRSHNLILLP